MMRAGILSMSAASSGRRSPTPRGASPRPAAGGRRLVVVSNRIATGAAAAGGLAVGLNAALRQSGGLWFGWSGEAVEAPKPAPKITVEGAVAYATVDLARQDYEEYYNGFANRVLWPLFHYRPDLTSFRRADFDGYLRVNRQFAAQLAPLLRPDDLVWVHDYHLLALGDELRRLGVTQPIGFFLHTPFPACEIFRMLPCNTVLMRALCSYDVVGFHTTTDLDGFRDYLQRRSGASLLPDGRIAAFGRQLKAAVFPIGIDVESIATQAGNAVGSRHMTRLSDSLGRRELMIGVDRLDYSKGLVHRFQAFERMVELFPELRGRATYLQIAPPSRSEVPEYMQIRHSLETAAGHINGRFAEFDWTPLRYLNKSFNQRTLCGFMRAARIGLVTPLRDGMNLVAKEYVAAQDPENPGVLILSCFAGAADELTDALLVNPYDIDAMAEAMRDGLTMPLEERRRRWQSMMAILRRHDITAWRENFVQALGESAAPAGTAIGP
jgi:trehalose 6-phosphate synthase